MSFADEVPFVRRASTDGRFLVVVDPKTEYLRIYEARDDLVYSSLIDCEGSTSARDGETSRVFYESALTVIESFAARTMPHANGQGHLALMGIRSLCRRALNGETIR